MELIVRDFEGVDCEEDLETGNEENVLL